MLTTDPSAGQTSPRRNTEPRAAAWLGVLSTGQLVLVALLAGAANVFFATAYQVCLPSVITAAELVAGNARLQGGASVAAIAGGRRPGGASASWPATLTSGH